MEKVKFDSAYTFKYSPRKGTKAMGYDDQINENIKQRRLEKLISLQSLHTKQRNENFIGKIEKVLIEKESKRDERKWSGRTDSNKWVVFDKSGYSVNDIVPVLITESRGCLLYTSPSPRD